MLRSQLMLSYYDEKWKATCKSAVIRLSSCVYLGLRSLVHVHSACCSTALLCRPKLEPSVASLLLEH